MGDAGPKFWWALGIATGAFCATFVFSVALAFLHWETLAHHIKEWQTLITGLLGVGVALLTIFWLERQIMLAGAQEEDRRERKQYADRAAMPAALATLVKYGRANLKILVALPAGLTPAGNIRFAAGWVPPPIPDYPSGAAETIRTCLESTDRDKRAPIAQILRDLQKVSSRLEGILGDVTTGSIMSVDMNYLSDYVLGALDFVVRCNITIPYARGDVLYPPEKPSLDEISSKAFFEDIYEDDFPFVYEAMQRRYLPMPPVSTE